MRITVTQAAKIMGVSPMFVRIGIQRGILKFGTCIKMSSEYTYHISSGALAEYLRITPEEVEKEVVKDET